MNVSISVIVPVYGVEGFVERCVRSLMEQTLREGMEFIFVDDATKDNSMDILLKTVKDYPHRQSQIKILRHDVNKGLPAARNTGLAAATGEYICHFDADDFAEIELLERFRDTAAQTDADYIWADWFLTYQHTSRLMRQASFSTPGQTLRALLTGQIKYNVWNKMVRRRLYTDHDICFPESHNMGEDMTMIRLAACAGSVAHLDYAGYHYVKTNAHAMTAALSEQSIRDIEHNVAETLAFLRTKMVAAELQNLGSAFCLHTKLPLLFSSSSRDYERWASLWPDCHRYIKTSGFSRRNTWLNLFASRGWWPLVRLHYYAHSLCYRLLYH